MYERRLPAAPPKLKMKIHRCQRRGDDRAHEHEHEHENASRQAPGAKRSVRTSRGPRAADSRGGRGCLSARTSAGLRRAQSLSRVAALHAPRSAYLGAHVSTPSSQDHPRAPAQEERGIEGEAYQSSEARKSLQSARIMSFTPGSSTIELMGRFWRAPFHRQHPYVLHAHSVYTKCERTG